MNINVIVYGLASIVGASMSGYVLSTLNIVSVVVLQLILPYISKFNRIKATQMSMLGLSAVMLAAAFPMPYYVSLIMLYVVQAASVLAQTMAKSTYVSQGTPQEAGALLGVSLSADSLARMTAPPVAMWILDKFSRPGVLVASAISALIAYKMASMSITPALKQKTEATKEKQSDDDSKKKEL
jgi:MFS family permease